MQDFWNQLIATDIMPLNATFRLLLSMVLGGMVGYERLKKGQIAGIRTFSLIAMGATLAMLVSIYIPQEYLGLKNGDPGRIAAQVVSGIGFLGAGAIIQMKGSVRGLTTAAGIWITAMIGLAVGAGMYLVAVITTLFIIFILVIIDRYEHFANIVGESKIVRIRVHKVITQEDIQLVKDIFKQHNIHITDVFFKYEYDGGDTLLNLMTRSKASTSYVPLCEAIAALFPTASITLSNEVNI